MKIPKYAVDINVSLPLTAVKKIFQERVSKNY